MSHNSRLLILDPLVIPWSHLERYNLHINNSSRCTTWVMCITHLNIIASLVLHILITQGLVLVLCCSQCHNQVYYKLPMVAIRCLLLMLHHICLHYLILLASSRNHLLHHMSLMSAHQYTDRVDHNHRSRRHPPYRINILLVTLLARHLHHLLCPQGLTNEIQPQELSAMPAGVLQ